MAEGYESDQDRKKWNGQQCGGMIWNLTGGDEYYQEGKERKEINCNIMVCYGI